MKYRRVLLKISGEAFGNKGQDCDPVKVDLVAKEIKVLRRTGVKLAIVCGGGNVIRGINDAKKDRLTADYQGMKATFKNIDFLSQTLKKKKVAHQIFTSFSVKKGNYPVFDNQKAENAWQKNKVIILGGGTGYPFFSTDTAAVLRGLQLGVDLLVKATKVDGVYNADPFKDKKAKKYSKISYQKFVEDNLKVIDLMAIALAYSNQLPIRVIKWQSGNVERVIKGQKLGTVIN
jgi:uridylate kinase